MWTTRNPNKSLRIPLSEPTPLCEGRNEWEMPWNSPTEDFCNPCHGDDTVAGKSYLQYTLDIDDLIKRMSAVCKDRYE